MQETLIVLIIVAIFIAIFIPKSFFVKEKKYHIIRNAGFIKFRAGLPPVMCYDVDHSSIEIKG